MEIKTLKSFGGLLADFLDFLIKKYINRENKQIILSINGEKHFLINFMSQDLISYFSKNPIFTLKEIKEGLPYKRSNASLAKLIYDHCKKGNLLKIKNGIYANVPFGIDAENIMVDSYLLASKLTNDAVIGYQSALGFWGKLHSIRNDLIYLTKKRLNKTIFSFQGIDYQAVSFPKALIEKQQELFGVVKSDRLGIDVSVTSLERTFVDILDKFYLLKDWEEVYRAFESIRNLELDSVIEYVLLLEKPTLINKVGFFLKLFQEIWSVEEKYLEKLETYKTHSVVHFDRNFKGGKKLIKDWNLIIPEILLTRNWEEPYEDI